MTTALASAILFTSAVATTAQAKAQPRGATAATTSATPARSSRRAALRLDASATPSPWVGQAVPVTVTATFRDVEQVTIEGPVRLASNAVITQELGAKPSQSREVVGGEEALVVRWTGTVTPSTPGPLDLRAELPVRIRYRAPAPIATRGRSRAEDPFSRLGPLGDDDPFGDPFASSMLREMQKRMAEMTDMADMVEPAGAVSEQELALTAQGREVSARALPAAGRPATFHGAVGRFDVHASLPSSELRVSEPVTLRVVVEGEGDLDRVSVAGVESSADFKAYPAHVVTAPGAAEKAGPGGHGAKTFEQTLVPLRAGDLSVPAVTLDAFDPARGAYVRDESTPLAVTVAAAATTTTTTATAPPATPPPEPPLAGPTPANDASGHTRWLSGGCALAALGALALAARSIARRTRARRAERSLARRMRRAAASGTTTSFLAAARDLIRVHLARRWGVPEEAVTGVAITDRLGEAGTPLARALALDAASRFGGPIAQPDLRTMCAAIEHTLAVA